MSNTLVRYFRKNILDSLLAVVILVLIFILAYSFDPEVFRLSNHRVAYLEVNDNGIRRAFEGEVVGGMTVLDALDASALAGNINFKYEIDRKSNELHIITLDGYSATKTPREAMLFLNLVRVDISKIHAIPLSFGDRILIRLE
ncbi:MAG: hypothetical protein Q7S43_00980 [bacterium]|nr:hypothetical protein [bacterium]